MTDSRPTGTPSTAPGDARANLWLALLVLYVILLAVGTVGELFDIRWILDLPIY